MSKALSFWRASSLGALLLLLVLHREGYLDRLLAVLRPEPPKVWDHRANPAFVEQTAFHALFEAQRDIVLLGNSHTFRMQWSELLARPDVANRGIGSDVLEGFLDRLPQVLRLAPRICFIEGGVNDIEKGVPLDHSLRCLARMVDTLQRHGVTPVVTQLIPVAGHYPDAVAFNREVSAFNRGIDSTFRGMDGVRILDLNPELAPTGVLESRFAQEDGIHLTPAAYRIWGRRIREVLSEAGI